MTRDPIVMRPAKKQVRPKRRGSSLSRVRDKDRRHHLHANTNPVEFAKTGPVMLSRGKGIYLYTDDGHKVIDGLSGGWCTHLGYGNPRLCKAAVQAMRQLSYTLTFGGRSNPWAARLSHEMAALSPPQYQHFFFSSTGSDAVESAIKLALYYWHLRNSPSKRAIISRDLAYHGNTLFAAHLIGADGYGAQYGFPLTDLVHRATSPYWYRFGRNQSPDQFGKTAAASLEAKLLEIGPENVAAFIAEPIQATLGLVIPPRTYWPEIQRICAKYDVLLIADEIVTGMGKTGRMFGFESFSFEPDLFTLAKGFSSGYFPISCVGIGNKISSVLQKADRVFAHGFTHCGHPVGCAIALEAIAVLQQERLIDAVHADIGPRVCNRLQDFLNFGCVGEVSCKGVIGAIEIDASRIGAGGHAESLALGARIGDIAWKKGLHVRPIGTTLAMMFPLISKKRQIDAAFAILKDSIAEAQKSAGM